jgi:hypothetical protein
LWKFKFVKITCPRYYCHLPLFALGKEVQDFLAENGDIPASEDTIEIFSGLRMQEKVLVVKKKRLGRTKQSLSLPARSCNMQTLFSITNISFLFSIRPRLQEDGAWAIPDCTLTSKVNKGVRIPFDLFNLLAELKTVCVLHEGVIEYILQHAVPGESWAEGKFDPEEAPSGQRVRYKKVAESMLRRV